MGGLFSFAASYWWLVFPISAVAGGWAGGIAKYNERRRRDKIEMLRIKHSAQAAQVEARRATDKQIDRVLAAHDEVNARWFAYETDVVTLIDYPLMTDMREPCTLEFHKAKVVADELRPVDRDELRDPAVLADYSDAVRAYRLAFDIAEQEARRRRQQDFSDNERSALQRARKLVTVAAAERQNAYRYARRELDGLIVLPQTTTDDLESKIAGALEAGQ